MLKYSLYPNVLTTDDPDDQVARPVEVLTRHLNDLIKEVTGKGSILKSTEVKAVIDAYWEAIHDFITKGEAYSDDYISIRFDISGVFQDKDDQFDAERHKVIVGVKLKKAVSKAVAELSLKKVNAQSNIPVIEETYDWGSDSYNDQITPGDVLEVFGKELKIQDTLAEEGVFLISQTDNTETKVSRVRTNEPSKLTLRVPSLPAGNYKLEIRNTRYKGKTLRVGILPNTLGVV